MDLEIVAAMGINMTLSIIMFLAVICLSGSLYSWWKTGILLKKSKDKTDHLSSLKPMLKNEN